MRYYCDCFVTVLFLVILAGVFLMINHLILIFYSGGCLKQISGTTE